MRDPDKCARDQVGSLAENPDSWPEIAPARAFAVRAFRIIATASRPAIAAFLPVALIQRSGEHALASLAAILDRTSQIDVRHLIFEQTANCANRDRAPAFFDGHRCIPDKTHLATDALAITSKARSLVWGMILSWVWRTS